MANYIKRFQNNGNYYYFGDAPVHITSITLNESSLTLDTVGDTYQLTAAVDNPDACDTYIHWSSSNSSIAVISKTGLVTCIYPGDCTITASCDGITATCSISYTKATGVTLNKSNIGLPNAGDTFQLIATVTPVDAAITDVTWSSSNTSIATVSDTGLVTCITPGECTITCTTVDGGYTASCSVTANIQAFDFLLVGGGGAGGGGIYSYEYASGGGGGGGIIECVCYDTLGDTSFNIVVGAGGTSRNCHGCNGGDSSLNNIIAYGGGGGGSEQGGSSGSNGGSGGGGVAGASSSGSGGEGCVGQGNKGGRGQSGYNQGKGGGGGGGGYCTAGCEGGHRSGSGMYGGDGGLGYDNCFGGIEAHYSYGGGGGGYCAPGSGNGYGGNGGCPSTVDCNGRNAVSYGSGGGGAGYSGKCNAGKGGAGYQGIVIIRYPSDGSYLINSATGGTITTCTIDGVEYKIHTFTSDGTFCIVC